MTVIFRDLTGKDKGKGTLRTDVKRCPYCPEDGHPFIFPETEEGSMAKRMPDGSYKCLTCQEEELKDRIVRVTPNSYRAYEIRGERNNRGI